VSKLSIKPNTGIPYPTATWPGMMATVQAMKDQVDKMSGDSGDLSAKAVTVQDLLTWGIIKDSDLAKMRKP
jgi:hypothetical protein